GRRAVIKPGNAKAGPLFLITCHKDALLWYYILVMRIRREDGQLNSEDIRLVAGCSDALGHPARVEIFQFIYSENLARRKVCNKDLVERFGLAQSTVSQHVSKLSASGLLEVQEQGTRNYYYVNIGLLGRYVNAIRKLSLPPSNQ
ncbi:MAG: winged helix-turn-helix transcriptional regulator, partial [Firmicutes bacterium]|nr:winged helix-turn-helix transcriptional regulator [Bacillota bacterium]